MLLVNRDKITNVRLENDMLKCELRKFPGNYMLVKPPLHLKLEKDVILRFNIEEGQLRIVPLRSTSKRFGNQFILDQVEKFIVPLESQTYYAILDDRQVDEQALIDEINSIQLA